MNKRESLAFGVVALLCILAVFYKTLFFAAPISRLDLIQQLDVLYNPSLQGRSVSVAQDPSACLQSIPKETFIQDSLKHFQLPIWNPLSGCGQPLIGDPANTLWSPIDLVFAPTNQSLYNIGLVLKVVLGGLFAYILFLRTGASPWAACTAATGYALSARILRGIELSTNFEMVPAVFLLFQILGRASRRNIAIFAIGLCFCYVCLHPEVFFIAVCTAAMLFLLEPIADRKMKALPEITRRIGSIALSGVLNFALLSPLILPFLEYLKYAHSYKYGASSIEYIRLEQFPFFLCLPKLFGTLFPGWVVLLGIPAGVVLALKKRWTTLPILFALIIFACRPYPFDEIFSKAPFSYLLPEYALGPILLLLCQFASFGLTAFEINGESREEDPTNVHDAPAIEMKKGYSWRRRFLTLIISILLIVLPAILTLTGGAAGQAQAGITGKALGTAILLLVLASLLMIFIAQFSNASGKYKHLALIAAIALPVLNLASSIVPARQELPVTAAVRIPPSNRAALIDKLQNVSNQQRITACGDSLMPPCTALLYGLSDLRTCSPLNDARYLKFMEAMGAKLGYCNMMQVPACLNRVIDLASVRYLVSDSPVSSLCDRRIPPGKAPGLRLANASGPGETVAGPSVSGRVMPGMRLMETQCDYYPGAAQVECRIVMRVHEHLLDRYQVQLALYDEANKLVWQSPWQNLRSAISRNHVADLTFLAPIPSVRPGEISACLQVLDTWTGTLIKPDGLRGDKLRQAVLLGQFAIAKHDDICSPDGRFTLIYESPDLIRIYRNERALPDAYLVHRVVAAGSGDDALRILSQPDFDAAGGVILENSKMAMPPATQAIVRDSGDSVQATVNRNTKREFLCKSNHDGILVVTDLFYDGWKAEVDGIPAELVRANYLFRGVPVKRGEHRVRMYYDPFSFNTGMVAFICACLFLIGFWKGEQTKDWIQSKTSGRH